MLLDGVQQELKLPKRRSVSLVATNWGKVLGVLLVLLDNLRENRTCRLPASSKLGVDSGRGHGKDQSMLCVWQSFLPWANKVLSCIFWRNNKAYYKYFFSFMAFALCFKLGNDSDWLTVWPHQKIVSPNASRCCLNTQREETPAMNWATTTASHSKNCFCNCLWATFPFFFTYRKEKLGHGTTSSHNSCTENKKSTKPNRCTSWYRV